MKNLGVVISISMVVSLLCVTAYAQTYPSISILNNGIWKIINGDTIVQNDTSLNVNIGENSSTVYKLNVNGTSNFIGKLDIHDGISLNNKAIGFKNNPTSPPYFYCDVLSDNLMNVVGSHDFISYFGLSKSFLIRDSFFSIVNKINLSSNGDISNTGKLNVMLDIKANKNLNVTQNITIKKNFNIIAHPNNDIFYIKYDDSMVDSYVKFVSPTGIELSANGGIGNIRLNGMLNIPDNICLGFGDGDLSTGGNPDFNIGYSTSTEELQISSIPTFFYHSKAFHVNSNKLNTDFIIDGDHTSKVFCLDASLDKINMTKVNVTSLLTIPCITTGASLTSYQVQGSILLNITTNLIGSYSGSSWKWR